MCRDFCPPSRACFGCTALAGRYQEGVEAWFLLRAFVVDTSATVLLRMKFIACVPKEKPVLGGVSCVSTTKVRTPLVPMFFFTFRYEHTSYFIVQICHVDTMCWRRRHVV